MSVSMVDKGKETMGDLRYDINTDELPFRIISDRKQANVAFTLSEDDARRFVACVNACEGISTENLETNKPLILAVRKMNELLKAVDSIEANLKFATSSGTLEEINQRLVESLRIAESVNTKTL